ncbi:hypothetical protein AN948_01465 [Rhodococcus sp. ADH]|nr:hypothetical protein AN948_01465 [Rhodococcus sp. ADH]
MARSRSRPRPIAISTWFHVDIMEAATDIAIRNLLSHLISCRTGREVPTVGTCSRGGSFADVSRFSSR